MHGFWGTEGHPGLGHLNRNTNKSLMGWLLKNKLSLHRLPGIFQGHPSPQEGGRKLVLIRLELSVRHISESDLTVALLPPQTRGDQALDAKVHLSLSVFT